jgi:hypothetical protein
VNKNYSCEIPLLLGIANEILVLKMSGKPTLQQFKMVIFFNDKSRSAETIKISQSHNSQVFS